MKNTPLLYLKLMDSVSEKKKKDEKMGRGLDTSLLKDFPFLSISYPVLSIWGLTKIAHS